MKNFLVIKDQDRGGSYFIKNELLPNFSARHNYIFDPNVEYGKFKNLTRNIFTKEDFLSRVPSKKNSSVNVVFEEASAFFSKAGNSSLDIFQHICRRFHTRNINVLVFHRLLGVPTDILTYIDFIVLFRTSDKAGKVHKDFEDYPNIVEAFNSVQMETDNTFFDRENKTYPDEYSRQHFHAKRIIHKPF